MTPFRSIIMVRYQPEPLAAAIRDRLPEIAALLDDVERVTVLERHEDSDGVRLVNEWRVRPRLPLPIGTFVDPDKLGWIDRAAWTSDVTTCRWTIDTLFLPRRIRCEGTTTYETAMGGRGSRVTFSGQLDIDSTALRGLGGFVEGIVTTVIPRNFRKTVEAAGQLLEAR